MAIYKPTLEVKNTYSLYGVIEKFSQLSKDEYETNSLEKSLYLLEICASNLIAIKWLITQKYKKEN